jgi:hypothetical protein
LKYVDDLKALGLHCESTYPLLQESVYPIDATQAHLDLLSSDPPQLEALIEPFGATHGLAIVVLAENSD